MRQTKAAAPAQGLGPALFKDGAAGGQPLVLLRVEGGVALVAATAAYAYFGGGWVLFALLFLIPDLSMAGYFFGSRPGAFFYNSAHTYAAPGLVAALLVLLGAPHQAVFCLIWAAHVGFDRLLGYGLKYPMGFGFTHLGRVGGARRSAQAGLAAT